MEKRTQSTAPKSAEQEGDPPLSSGDISRLYHDLRTGLMRFASRYFKKPQEIEDVVQEAFVKVIEAQRQRDIHFPKAYLYQATKNLALQQLDKSAYRLTDTIGDLLPESVLLESVPLEQEFESQQRLALFCRAVRTLPIKCQRVYILRRVYGFSQKEIAERLDITVKTVESHLTKAIVRCTDYMDEAESVETHAESYSKEHKEGDYHG